MAYIQAPYAPAERYQRNSRLLDLMARQGQQAAEATAQRGERLGNLVAGIGSTLGKGISDIQQYRREEPERQLRLRDLAGRAAESDLKIRTAERTLRGQQVLAEAQQQSNDPQEVARAVAQAGYSDLAQAFLKNQVDLADAFQALTSGKIKTATEFNQLEAKFYAPILQAPPEEQQTRWTAARASLAALGLDLSGVPDTFDPVAAKAHVETWAPTERAAPGSMATRGGIPVPGSQVPFAPTAPRPPLAVEQQALQTFARERGKTPQDLSEAEMLLFRKTYQTVDDRPPTAQTVIIQTVDAAGNPVTKIVPKVAGSEFGAPPTADMRNKEAGRALVTKSINAIQDLSTRIITKIGPAQRAAAISRGVNAVFGNDPEFITYQDARTALAGNLAVAQQGSRPSDADIKSIWLPLVPDAYRDTKESAAMKWNLIRAMSNVSDATETTETSTAPLGGISFQDYQKSQGK